MRERVGGSVSVSAVGGMAGAERGGGRCGHFWEGGRLGGGRGQELRSKSTSARAQRHF